MASFWPLFLLFLAFDFWFAYDGFISRDPEMAKHAMFNQVMTLIVAIPTTFLGLHFFEGMSAGPAADSDPLNPPSEADSRWNWGAFGMAPAWALGNRVYWGLLSIIPIAGIAVVIALGIRGYRLARRTYPWKSEAEFLRTQRIWTRWGIGGCIFQVVAAASLIFSNAPAA